MSQITEEFNTIESKYFAKACLGPFKAPLGVKLEAEEATAFCPVLDSLKNDLTAFLKCCEEKEKSIFQVRHTYTHSSTLIKLVQEVGQLQLSLTLEQAQIMGDLKVHLESNPKKKVKIYVRMAKALLEILGSIEVILQGTPMKENEVIGEVSATFLSPEVVEAMRENDPLTVVETGVDIVELPLLVKSPDIDFKDYIKLALEGKRSGNYVFSRADLEHIDSMIKVADADYQAITEMEQAAELASERLTQRADVIEKVKLRQKELEVELNCYKSKFNGASSACNTYRQEIEQKDSVIVLGVININKVREALEEVSEQNGHLQEVNKTQSVAVRGLQIEVDRYDDMYNTLVAKAEKLQEHITSLPLLKEELTGSYTYERGTGSALIIETFDSIPISVIERMHDKNNSRHVEVAEITGIDFGEEEKEATSMMVDTSLLSEEEKEALVNAVQTIIVQGNNGIIEPDTDLERCPIEMDDQAFLD